MIEDFVDEIRATLDDSMVSEKYWSVIGYCRMSNALDLVVSQDAE